MEEGQFVNNSLNQVKCSLDELQQLIESGDNSQDSLKRLQRALLDINEEVNMLKNVFEFNSHQ